MPTFIVTGPDGKEYEVDGPEGATPEQALQQVQMQVGGQQQPAQEQPSAIKNALDTYLRLSHGGLIGSGFEAMDKAAYNTGGAVTDLTGSPVLGTAVNVGLQSIPMMAGGEVAKGASPAFQGTAKWLMQSALKPGSTPKALAQGEKAVSTMLKEGANVSPGGVEKLRGTLDKLGGEVEKAISKSGATIKTADIADYVPQAYSRFSSGPLARQAVEDLGGVQNIFMEHPLIEGQREIPVQVAQKLKQGYQRAIGDKGYGELKSAVTEGEKQIARGAREKIAEAVPSVVERLKRESDIINALKFAQKRVAVEANKNPIGLGALLTQPWMAPIWMWDRSALAKSITANLLNSGSQRIPQTLGELLAGGAVGYNNLPPALDPNTGGVLYR